MVPGLSTNPLGHSAVVVAKITEIATMVLKSTKNKCRKLKRAFSLVSKTAVYTAVIMCTIPKFQNSELGNFKIPTSQSAKDRNLII